MFAGFRQSTIDVGETTIRVRHGGSAPPLLLLHGNPQTSATRHAICEDYRAAATLGCAHDEADRAAGRRIRCPVLALWGGRGKLGAWYDVLAIWRDWAEDASGHALDCGHYLAEEAPEKTRAALLSFFVQGETR